jgi:hypothetical protein
MKNTCHDDQKKMYVQAPVEAEKKVSTMVAMFTSCRGNRVRVRDEIADKEDLLQQKNNIKTESTASTITPIASSKYDEDDCCVDVSSIDYLMDASPSESPMKVPSKPVDCCVVPPSFNRESTGGSTIETDAIGTTSPYIEPLKPVYCSFIPQQPTKFVIHPIYDLLPAASRPPVDCCDPLASECPYETPMIVVTPLSTPCHLLKLLKPNKRRC